MDIFCDLFNCFSEFVSACFFLLLEENKHFKAKLSLREFQKKDFEDLTIGSDDMKVAANFDQTFKILVCHDH